MAKSRFVMFVALLGLGAAAAPFGQTPVPPPGQQGKPATGFIAGTVVDSAGRPIPEAMVSITGALAGGRAMALPGVIADERGRYFFRNVAPGIYRLQASKTGYGAIRSGMQFVVELADGERVVDRRIRLAKVASIAGTVRDTAGDPVVGTEILLFRRTIVNGRQGLQSSMRGVKTDDRGPVPAAEPDGRRLSRLRMPSRSESARSTVADDAGIRAAQFAERGGPRAQSRRRRRLAGRDTAHLCADISPGRQIRSPRSSCHARRR